MKMHYFFKNLFLYTQFKIRQSEGIVVMTKEESTKILNFMTHGAGVFVLGHSHIVKCNSSYLLVYTGAWIKQIKSIVIVTKELSI